MNGSTGKARFAGFQVLRATKSRPMFAECSVAALVACALLLAACGGGGGGGGSGGGVPSPTASITSAPISRTVVVGTSVYAKATLSLSFVPSGTLSVQVDQTPAAPFLSSVDVVPGGNGAYTLNIFTSSTAAEGHYTGPATLKLCANAACTTVQPVASVKLPYTVDVLSGASAWPGDHQTTLSALAGAPDWSTFQGNSAHTGFVPVDLDPDKVTTRWQISGGGALSTFGDMPRTVATSGGLFFLSSDAAVSARRESDASVVWQYDFSGLTYPTANAPAVSNGTVYVAAGHQADTFLFAFNASGGSLVFKAPMTSQWESYLAPTAGPAGVYANGGTYGGIYGFARTGETMFFDSAEQTSLWSPAVDANSVYVYTGHYLRVLDPVTGAVRGAIVDPTFTDYIHEIGGAPVLGDSGLVFAANYSNSLVNGGDIGNTLTAFDTSAGTIAWQVSGTYPTTPAYHAGHLYVANERPMRVEVRAADTGALEWSWVPPSGTDFYSEVLVTNNQLFVSTNYALYAIDLASHEPVWSYPGSGHLALSANGVLYFQNANRITAFNLK